MFYIVGLGNPGKKYALSRHNIGWLVLDAIIKNKNWPMPISNKKCPGKITTGKMADFAVTLLYPDTYMNDSGVAIKKLVPKKDTHKLIVVYDDIALPFGAIRISFGRGYGGHNGLASVIKAVGTKDFVRIRMGIGQVGFWPWEERGLRQRPTGDTLVKYVLSNFKISERIKLPKITARAAEAISDSVKLGYSQAMNIYNQEK